MSSTPLVQIRGRGAVSNPANRFERIDFALERETLDEDDPAPRTTFLRDTTRGIIARNDSPDVGFETSVNPYRGASTAASTASRGPHTSTWASPQGWTSRRASW
jgi:hypothetical protein